MKDYIKDIRVELTSYMVEPMMVDLSQHIIIPQHTPPVEREEVCRNIRRGHDPRYCAGYKALYLQAEYIY